MRFGIPILLLASCAAREVELPREPQTLNHLAAAAEAEANLDWEVAAWHLDVWARNQPPDEEWWQRRLRAADGAGQWEVAVGFRRQRLDLTPEDVSLRCALAETLFANDQGDEALACLAEDDDPRCAELSAVLLLRLGRSKEAAQAFERLANSQNGSLQGALYEEAAAAWRLAGDRSAALRCLELALGDTELTPKQEQLRRHLRALDSGIPETGTDAVALLKQGDSEGRLAAVRYLARGQFPMENEIFLSALSDSEPRVVAVALRELGRRAPDQAHPLIAEYLQNAETGIRLAAVEAASWSGDDAFVPLLLKLMDPKKRAEFRAIRSALLRLTGHVEGIEMDPNLTQRDALMRGWRLWWTTQGGEGAAPSS